jgi:hypothetical protein
MGSTHPLHRLAPQGFDPEVFHSRPDRQTKVYRTSSRKVLLAFRVLPTCTVPGITPGHSFHEVFVPSASSVPGVHESRACLTRYVPLAGFLNLLAAYSSKYLAGLFRPADTHGILTLQSFLLPTSRTPFRRRVALLTLPSRNSQSPRISWVCRRLRFRPRFRSRKTWRSSSGRFSRRELVHGQAILLALISRCSPGFVPL